LELALVGLRSLYSAQMLKRKLFRWIFLSFYDRVLAFEDVIKTHEKTVQDAGVARKYSDRFRETMPITSSIP
jgi:hypothetical protein